MANAAIYFHTDGYDTSGKRLLGRHSAGESFLRGFLRHADVDRFDFWNVGARPTEELDALIARIEPPARPVRRVPPPHPHHPPPPPGPPTPPPPPPPPTRPRPRG